LARAGVVAGHGVIIDGSFRSVLSCVVINGAYV